MGKQYQASLRGPSQVGRVASAACLGSCDAKVKLAELSPGIPQSRMIVPVEMAGPLVLEGPSPMNVEGAFPAAGAAVCPLVWGCPGEWMGSRGVGTASMAGTPPLEIRMSLSLRSAHGDSGVRPVLCRWWQSGTDGVSRAAVIDGHSKRPGTEATGGPERSCFFLVLPSGRVGGGLWHWFRRICL